jgi:CRP/FNR family transcriptional regulator
VSKNSTTANGAATAGVAPDSSILEGLPAPLIKRLLTGAEEVTLQDGERLFGEGDSGDGCYWLRSGLLKVSVSSPAGEKRTLAILGPGSIVGEISMLDGLPRSANVHAISDCALTFVRRDAFVDFLSKDPALYRNISLILAARLRQANDEAAAASFLPVKERVARTLLRLAGYLGERIGESDIAIHHRISQNDIAAMAGLARESVNRTLNEWRRKGIVDMPARGQLVVHRQRLELELKAAAR